jgi:putative transposase
MKAVEELSPQVGTTAACHSLGVPRATLYRHRQPKLAEPATTPRPKPPRALSDQERQQVVDVLHSEPFADKAPAEVYAALLDEGHYFCSIRTMYRILDDRQEVRERRDQLRHPTYHKPQLLATAPNQVWSWDITKLLGPAKWTYFHLYVILDIFSRYVVGWMLAHRESEDLAQRLIRETVMKQGIVRDQLTIHSDRGPSMHSQTVAQLLATLGITKSHSRPHVSDDNPFSESQFKTLKYRPEFPDRFASIEHGLDFCGKFFHWQNHEHHHWGLGLLTPAMVHDGQADTVLAARQTVLTAAYAAHPERFVGQPPRPLALPREVWINPPADGPEPRMLQLPHDTNFVPQLSQTH